MQNRDYDGKKANRLRKEQNKKRKEKDILKIVIKESNKGMEENQGRFVRRGKRKEEKINVQREKKKRIGGLKMK